MLFGMVQDYSMLWIHQLGLHPVPETAMPEHP